MYLPTSPPSVQWKTAVLQCLRDRCVVDCLFVKGGLGLHNTFRRHTECHVESLGPEDKAPADTDDIDLEIIFRQI